MYTWLINNLDVIAIVISIISLVITGYNIYSKWKNERVNLNLEIKNSFQIHTIPDILFLEIAITNRSRLQVTIENLIIKMEQAKISGEVHDVNQKFVGDDIMISDLPITITALGSSRIWIRFNLDEELPKDFKNKENKLEAVCFGKLLKHPVYIPPSLTEQELLEIL